MKFYDLKIASIEQNTSESRVVSFEVPQELREIFAFNAGQYLTLESGDVRRSYSLCDTKTLSVGIKTIEGGAFSSLAFTLGSTLKVSPPQGKFVLPKPMQAKTVALIGAGSGITPLLALAQDLLENHPHTNVIVLYGNKNTSSIMFREKIEELKNKYLTRLTLTHILTRETSDIALLHGRLTQEKIIKLLSGNETPELSFLCGPQDVVEAGEKALLSLGLSASQIKKELFTTTTPPREKVLISAKPAIALALTYDGQSYALDIDEAETVLEAAERQGLDLPFSCKGGMCCTCRAKVEEGEAEMLVNYSLEAWEIERGFTLTCQAKAKSKALHINFDAL